MTVEDEFDFRVHTELCRKVFQSYLEETFVREGKSLVLIGVPGLGKTYLSITIGIQSVKLGFDVRFVTVQSLVNKVLEPESLKEGSTPRLRSAILYWLIPATLAFTTKQIRQTRPRETSVPWGIFNRILLTKLGTFRQDFTASVSSSLKQEKLT